MGGTEGGGERDREGGGGGGGGGGVGGGGVERREVGGRRGSVRAERYREIYRVRGTESEVEGEWKRVLRDRGE